MYVMYVCSHIDVYVCIVYICIAQVMYHVLIVAPLQ